MTGTVTLRELLPIDQAKLLTMTGRVLNGVEAKAMNLVTGVSETPLLEAEKLVAEIKTRSPDSVAATKDLFQENWLAGVRRAFNKEVRAQVGLLLGKNQKIAMNANFKKKSPEFLPRK
jgi:enoyl-CoA hydratase/carnithine racemase